MQKDIHFYLTYALAREIGISNKEAELIAWADQFTDDLTTADIHGFQTQSDTLGNWDDKQIQISVLLPFHFIPGSDTIHPWKVTRNNARARSLVNEAIKDHNPIQVGVALHSYQDTFSHENFSGWREDLNSCYPWYYIKSGLPNIGHAEMLVTPDIANVTWTDPRDGRVIDNKKRALAAAKGTFNFLVKYSGKTVVPILWKDIGKKLINIFKIKSYDDRKKAIIVLSGNTKIKYKKLHKKLEPKNEPAFVKAASIHLSRAMDLFSDLPWLK